MAGKGGRRSTTFVKGQSGNPAGRPKIVGEIRDLARQHTADALLALVQIATRGKNEGAKVAAAQALLDRGYGKATQHIEANVNLLDRLSLDDQQALLAALAAVSAGEGADRDGAAPTHH